MELDQRKQRILKEIINSYIISGEPVGSKSLLEFADFSVSSATIILKSLKKSFSYRLVCFIHIGAS